MMPMILTPMKKRFQGQHQHLGKLKPIRGWRLRTWTDTLLMRDQLVRLTLIFVFPTRPYIFIFNMKFNFFHGAMCTFDVWEGKAVVCRPLDLNVKSSSVEKCGYTRSYKACENKLRGDRGAISAL